MSEVRYTPEQENAIRSGGRFIIVSAAAGSGKTAVLVEKLVRLLSDTENRVRADELVVVTFTNDAANQLRKKLAEKLSQAVNECVSGADKDKKSWLIKQQSRLGAAHISTISSFCFSLIREHADKLGISSDFRIIDENRGKLMLLDAIENVSDAWSMDEDKKEKIDRIWDFLDLYDSVGEDRYKDIVSMRSFLLSVPFYEQTLVKRCLDEYKKAFDEDFAPENSLYGKLYIDNIREAFDRYDAWDRIDVISELILDETLAENAPNLDAGNKTKKSSEFYYQSLEYTKALVNIKKFLSDETDSENIDIWKEIGNVVSKDTKKTGLYNTGLTSTRVTSLCKLLSNSGIAPAREMRVTARGERPENDKEYNKRLKEYTNDTYSVCADMLSGTAGILIRLPYADEECIVTDYRDHYEKLSVMLEFIEDVNREFAEAKREINGLIFEDAELLSLRLLGKVDDSGSIVKTETAQMLSESLSLVLIDEFQDSNDIQDMIFRLISKNGDMNSNGQNMFIVGDLKQSIYNFRLANPKIFADYLGNSVLYDGDNENTEPSHVLLNRNFRCSEKVIKTVNLVFGCVMTEKCGGIDYDETQELVYSGEAWEKRNSDYADALGSSDTELLLIDPLNLPIYTDSASVSSDSETSEEPDENELMFDDGADILEARIVAMKIFRILQENKNIQPRDICVLVQKNKTAVMFEREISALGIQAAAENRNSYIESREISVALGFLRVTDNPHNNMAMMTCLLSPVTDVTEDDAAMLAVIRKSLSDKKKQYSYYRVMRYIVDMFSDETDRSGDIADICALCGCSEDVMRRLAEKTARFIGILAVIRKKSAVSSIENILRVIYSETHLVDIMSLYSDGQVKRANLLLLSEYAKDYESDNSGGVGGIYGFLSYIDLRIPNRMDFVGGSSATEADNAVRIKTFHKSKGLEFNIVFMCGLHKNEAKSFADARKDKIIKNRNAIAFMKTNEDVGGSYLSVPAEFIINDNEQELVSEKLRLMYVAMTRPIHKLYISCVTELADKKEGCAFYKNALTSEDAYRFFEYDVTDCETPKKLGDSIEKLISSHDREVINPYGQMSKWLFAALAMSSDIPFFSVPLDSAGGNVCHADFIKVKAMHYDSSLYEHMISDEMQSDIAETDGSADIDSAFEKKLVEYSRYDTDEKYKKDILKESADAKVSVTEAKKRMNEEKMLTETEKLVEYTPELDMSENMRSVRYDREMNNDGIKPLGVSIEKKLRPEERGTAIHVFMQNADLLRLETETAKDPKKAVLDEIERLESKNILTQAYADYIREESENGGFPKKMLEFFGSELWKGIMRPAENENRIEKEISFMAKFEDIFDEKSENTLDERIKKCYTDNMIDGDTFIQGTADCVVLEKDAGGKPTGFIVIDYKTDRNRKKESLIKEYEAQILLYRRIFGKIYDLSENSGRMFIWAFNSPEHEIEITE